MTFSNSPSSGVALQGGGGSGGAGASAPLTGTGAIVATSQPLIDVSQTWSNAAVTFTSLKLNITDTASNAASLLMDLGTGGGSFVSKFSVQKNGYTKAVFATINSGASELNLNFYQPGFGVSSTGQFTFGSAASASGADTILTRRGAANLRLGAADAAAPVAQTLSVQSVVAGTTNTAGQNFTLTGSQGTGTGAGGSLIFQVAPAGAAPTVQNALRAALTIASANIKFSPEGGSVDFVDGSDVAQVNINIQTTNGIRIASDRPLGWTAGAANGSSPDVALRRDDANKLALKNGANAQEFRVYETTTGTIYKAILGNRQLMKIAGAAFDNGAGASAGTLANAPAVGNPTKWIPIDDNGTTRYIPAW